MNPSKKDYSVSIRLRLEKSLLDRIDRIVGERGRQKFIKDALLWRLDQELPPVVAELIDTVSQLEERVGHLEGTQSTSIYIGGMSDRVRTELCKDDLDRNIIAYFLKHDGASTPELAEQLLNDSSKRKTIHVRLRKLNDKAEQILGSRILRYDKGEVRGKRGAWWIIDSRLLIE